MNKQVKLAAAAVLAAAMHVAPSASAADWYAPQEPFRLWGNTYYVGTGGISAVLITSPSGHILVDVGGPEAPVQVIEHIRKLGFRVEDIRYILNSHEHFDHAGGIAELQKLSGATVLASPESANVLRTGHADKGDAQFPNLDDMAPVANTRAVHDGEAITLGPIAVTAHFTHGHTKGGTSWTWAGVENGKTVYIVYSDSLIGVAADGLSFSRNPLYPNAKAELEKSMDSVESLKCDLLVSAHPEASHLFERKARQVAEGDAAFIDQGACRAYVSDARAWLTRQLVKEQ
jgi:metallo-beta-lactamase class B